MTNRIKDAIEDVATFTLSLAGLAAGSARQSTLVANATPTFKGAQIFLGIMSGGVAPTAGGTYDAYLIRSSENVSPNVRTDNAGASDAAITVENARHIGSAVVTATASKVFTIDVDTRDLPLALGEEWGIIIENNTDQALNATEGNHDKEYRHVDPEIQ